MRVFDRPNVDQHNLMAVLPAIEVVRGDFLNEKDLEIAVAGIDVVIHLISTTLPSSSNLNPVYDVETNILGTVRLLSMARRLGVQRFVFASSGGTVYGIPKSIPIGENHPTDPICSYGIGKLAVEKYMQLFQRLHGLECVALRISNPFGERQNPASGVGAVTTFLAKLLANETITIWGNGLVRRDYFYVGDLVDAFSAVVERPLVSPTYNISSGIARSLLEIIEVAEAVTGRKATVNFVEGRNLDVPVNCLDSTRAKAELDWRCSVPFESAVGRTWDWLQKNAGRSVTQN